MKQDNGFYIETIHGEYQGYDDPVFFDKALFPWVADLENSFDDIRACLAPLLDDRFDTLVANPEIHLQLPLRSWKSYPFYFNGIKFKKNLACFPLLAGKLASIPELISASVSVLEPDARVLPHNGSTNAVMRIHLPLKVPGVYPDCGMNIEGHEISWKEGEIFMFCDMKMHHVQNLTNERRYILLMDVMRPEYVHLKKMVCVHIIARILVNVIMNLVKAVLRK